MRKHIREALECLQRTNDVKIIYACEAGSRAYGTAGPDSDYDLRFIYVKPTERYLSIAPGSDQISYKKSTIDAQGWDLAKVLKLLKKSNVSLYEWLYSPIVYEDKDVLGELRSAASVYYSAVAHAYHYSGLVAKSPVVCLTAKEALFVLRAILACEWISNRKGPVPVDFSTLVDEVASQDIRAECYKCIDFKKNGVEWVDSDRLEQYVLEAKQLYTRKDWKQVLTSHKTGDFDMDALFRKTLCAVNGSAIHV